MKILTSALFVILILAACSAGEPLEPAATATEDRLSTVIAEQVQPTTVPTEAPSATPTPTATDTFTPTATFTNTPTPTDTPSHTPTFTPTATPTETYTSTFTPSPTNTLTPSPSPTLTATIPPTNTQVIISAPTLTPTEIAQLPTATVTLTPEPAIPGFLPSVVPIPADPTPTQVLIAAPTEVPTLPPGVVPTNTPRFTASPTLIPGDHLWFWRPFPRDNNGGVSDVPARGYAYGSSAGGGLPVHHGIDIQNTTGTPIMSIGSGTVFYAGPDIDTPFGPQPDFYGNVVVIEHDVLAPNRQAIFSLYGHMSRVEVARGDQVGFGTVLGSVGSEGVALGPHLHLEIRLGDPFDYNSTYNPELWIAPWDRFGVLAARVTGPDGELVHGVRIELAGRGSFFSGWTYGNNHLNSDPYYRENMVIGDIRSGQYVLKVGEARNVVYTTDLNIVGGVVNLIEIQLDELPADIVVTEEPTG